MHVKEDVRIRMGLVRYRTLNVSFCGKRIFANFKMYLNQRDNFNGQANLLY